MGDTRRRGNPPASRREAGATMVEFALILPVFAMLLFGMLTAGLALNAKQDMTQATREGARFAAAVPADQAGFTQTWAATVRQLVVDRSDGTLTVGDICVSLVQGDKPTSAITTTLHPTAPYFSTKAGGAPCIAQQTYPVTSTDTGRRVQVTATKPAKIELIVFGSYQMMMATDATAKSESSK